MQDIEIYIREPSIKRLLGWLKSELGRVDECPPNQGQKNVQVYRAVDTEPAIPIIIQLSVEGGPFVGVWFDSDKTPWQSDIECARAAFTAFGLPVMCDPGPEHDNQDDFYRIDAHGEQLVRLKGGKLGH